MCGIVGFIGPKDHGMLQGMFEAIKHRGPDQKGEAEFDQCSLAHARLSIIDLSEAGRQPMSTKDGRYHLVYNGEIYNYRELRTRYEKEGWKFQSTSDTECLLASIALHRLDDLADFHGIFAFVVWDEKEKIAYAARDRMGIKPLFMSRVGERTVFASELPAILGLKNDWHKNRRSRSAYFTIGYVPGPETMIEGIESVEHGVLLRLTANGLRPTAKSYLPSAVSRQLSAVSFSDAVDQTRTLVDATVANQLVSDRPIGVFLSGGLDSTVVLSSMRKAQPHAQIKTFTTRFSHETNDPKFNRDAELAQIIAKQYGCEHFEITVGTDDVIRESSTIARHLGQPHANHAVPALDAAARLAQEHVPVILSGDGGDESFGGYERYRLYATWGKRLASSFVRATIGGLIGLRLVRRDLEDLARANTEAARMLFFHAASLSNRKRLFGRAIDDGVVVEKWMSLLKNMSSRDHVSRFMELDRATWLCDDAFVRSDRLTMAHGIELRVPLTDDAIVDFAASLPREYHVTAHETKRLWRAAFNDRLPAEASNEAKRGWFPPTAKWYREGLHDWAEEILEDAIRTHDWMNGPEIRACWKNHLERRSYHLPEIQAIIGYQLWWREFGNRISQ
ncbi:MAG: asparagine synthase (glutamine-hydrolyzing) [Patescibacteria group bacterium]